MWKGVVIMNAKDTIIALWEALQKGQYTVAKSLLGEEFIFSGSNPMPMNGEEWIRTQENLRKAFPDIDFHMVVRSENGEVVGITHQLSGTHLGNLDLTMMGLGIIPPSGKSFSIPQQKAEGIVRNGKVVKYTVQSSNDSGMMAILSAIGVAVPQI